MSARTKLVDQWRRLRETARAAADDALHVSVTTASSEPGADPTPGLLTRIDLDGDVRTVVFSEALPLSLMAFHRTTVDIAVQLHHDRIESAIRILSAAL